MTLPLGVQHHNPLNMRPVQPPFEGTVGIVAGPGGDFTVYQSNPFGFRAAQRQIMNWYDDKYRTGQVNTIRGIISRWAPSSENDTEAYITAVCKSTGFGPDLPLETKTYDIAYKLLYAMTVHEQGSFDAYFKKWELDDGLRRAGVSDVPATPLHKSAAAVGGLIAAGAGTAAVVAPIVQSTIISVQAAAPQLHTNWLIGAVIAGGLLSVYAAFAQKKKESS